MAYGIEKGPHSQPSRCASHASNARHFVEQAVEGAVGSWGLGREIADAVRLAPFDVCRGAAADLEELLEPLADFCEPKPLVEKAPCTGKQIAYSIEPSSSAYWMTESFFFVVIERACVNARQRCSRLEFAPLLSNEALK